MMKIALRDILYDERPLIWDYDPETNELVCPIPGGQKKQFARAFQDYPGIIMEKKRLRIGQAREFIGQRPVAFVIGENRFINTDMNVLGMLLAQITVMSANSSIENKLDEFLKHLDSMLLSDLYTELEQKNPLIIQYPVLERAIARSRDNPDMSRSSSMASSSNSIGRASPEEINDLLMMLSRDASAYTAIEQVMVDYLQRHSNYLELIASIIEQDETLKTVADDAWARAIQRVDVDQSLSTSSYSATRSSQKASMYSRSESPLFFAKKIHPTQGLKLNDILDREHQVQTEFRQTFIHEDGGFLRIAETANEAMLRYPIHTGESFNISVTALEKNIAVYQLKRRLLNEIKILFDDHIDPVWRLSSFGNDPELENTMKTWFKTAALDILKTLPESGETEKQWQERINKMMSKLDCLASDRIAIKKMDIDEKIGRTLEKLKGSIRDNPDLKKSLRDNLKIIRKALDMIGDAEFASRKESGRIAQLTAKREKQIRGCHLFSDLLAGILKKTHPRFNSEDLIKRINKVAIQTIKQCNDGFINRLKESGLQPDDEQYEEVIKDPSTRINNYTRRLLSDYFYVGEPLATTFNEGLHTICASSDLSNPEGVELFVQQIDRLFELQISGLLTRLFEEPLKQAQALSAGSSSAPSM